MAKLSKFVKVDKNILLEYIYDDDNNIGESYEVLVNSKDRKQSYLATSHLEQTILKIIHFLF